MSGKSKIPLIENIKNFIPIRKEEEKSISFSQIQTYYECPHKWNLKYRLGYYEDKPSINLVFGTSIHETLQHYLNIMYNISGAEADRIDINKFFEESFIKNYEKIQKEKGHFSNVLEMHEFFYDGLDIISFFVKNKNKFFTKRKYHLVGCEIPLLINPNSTYKNIIFKGFIDIVLYHEDTNSFILYDIKTSTRGWSSYEKKDEIKQAQLLFYKEYFSKQYNIPIENIKVIFLILKRKLWEKSQYPQKRISEFSPSQGSWKIKKSGELLEQFLNECFDLEGNYKEKNFTKNISKKCNWCPFNLNKELCNKEI